MAEAGTVWVTVVPSLKGFSTKMKAALKGEDLGVQVAAKIDPKQVAAEAKKATAGVSATIEIDADIAVAKTKIAEVEKNLAALKRTAAADNPQLDLDIAAAEAKAAKLTADLAKLRALDASPEVNLKIATAEQQLGRVNSELAALQGRKVTPEVDVQISEAERQLTEFRAELARLETERANVPVDVDTGGALAKLDALRLRLQTWTATTANKKIDIDTGDSLIKIGLLSSALQTIALPAGIVAATPYLLSLGASAVQASGGLALIPAAIGGGVLAIGALKVATSGVGKAIGDAFDPTKVKTFQKDLEALTPPARDFVLQVQGMGPALNALQTSTATAFFAGLGAQIRPLGQIYLPILTSGFVGIVGAINGAILALAGWLRSATGIAVVSDLTANTAATVANLAQALAPLAAGFLQVAAVGSQVLTDLSFGATQVAVNFANWTQSAQGINTIRGWIMGAIAVVQQLWQLAVNVGSILGSMFTAGAASGESFIGILVRVTGQIAAALRTPAGAAQLTAVLAGIRDVVGMVWDKLVQLWPAISAVGSAMWALLQAASPVTSLFFSLLVPAVTALANAIAWMAPFLGPLVAGMLALSLVSKLTAVATVAQTLAVGALNGVLAIANGVMFTVRIATLLWAAAQWVLNAALSPLGLIILAVGAAVALLAFGIYELITHWTQVTTFISGVFGPVLSWLGAQFVWLWQAVIVPAWNAIAAAVMWAWTTIIKPVFDAIGVAITAVGNFFVWLWQAVIVPAWNGIVAAVTWAWTTVLSPIFNFIGTALAYLGAIVFTLFVAPFLIAWNLIVAAAQGAWIVLQAIWYGAIVPALQFLGSIFTWLYVNIVQPVWNAIVLAISVAWAVISAIWNAVIAFIVGVFAATWNFLYTGVIAPVWNAITLAISIAWAVISGIWNIIIGFIVGAFQAAWQFLYNGIILPVWNAIVAAIQFAWVVISGIWNAIIGFIMGVFQATWQFLYNGIIVPVWNAIVAAIQFAWGVIQAIWNAIIGFIQGPLAGAINWLYTNVVKPVWDAIGAAISFTWTNVIDPAFQAIWGGLQWLWARFQDAVNWITNIWNGIRGALARPINFMINTVWNNGILRAWNAVAGLLGIAPIAPLAPIPEFASGGQVDATGGGMLAGPGSGTSDAILARVSNGEFVVRATIAKKIPYFLHALNSGQPEAMQATGGRRQTMPGYRRLPPDRLLGYAGGGVIAGQQFAAANNGKPYVWGGVGPGGYDCSGWMSAMTNVLRGQAPYNRIGSTADFPWGGFTPGLTSSWAIGSTPDSGDGIGHMAGTLAGMNTESSGSVGVHSGGGARGADNGLFNVHASLPESGGVFASGGAGGGGGINFIAMAVQAAFDSFTNPLLDAIHALVGDPPPEYRRIPVALATTARDKVRDWLMAKAGLLGGGPAMGATAADAPGIVKIISDVAKARFGALAKDAAVIGVATGLVESNLHNSAVATDHDSVGVFQQRPSMGWGTVGQLTNVAYAAGAFFSKFPANWHSMDPGALAQSVQRSAYPARYGQRMAQALQLVNQFGGFDSGGIARGMGIMLKQTIQPERVLSPRQTTAFEQLAPLLTSLHNAGALRPYDPASYAAATSMPRDFRLVGGRIDLGDGFVELVDARLEAVTDAYIDGRRG